MVADLSAVILLNAMVDAHVLLEVIFVADPKRFCPICAVAEILRYATDGGAMTHPVACPHMRLTIDPNMAFDHAVGAEHSARFDDAECADLDARVDCDVILNDGARVDQGHGFLAMEQ